MRIRALLGLSLVVSLAAVSAPAIVGTRSAQAQSAADKATARQLATEGIKLYNDGKYRDALDKLERAEKLFDAPPHLLYIARCQVALKQLVEGAETYRTLVRTDLPAGSPAAFKQAVADGEKELNALEPKIPTVKIQVKPEGVSGLEVKVDDEKVPTAAVGVARPINPGPHTIRVSAPGFEPAEQKIEIKASEKKSVSLELKTASGAPPPVEPTPGETGAPTGKQPTTAAQPTGATTAAATTPAAPSEPSQFGFMLGARLGVALPNGDLVKERGMPDTFGPGGGLELHGGVRFARYFTGKLLVGGYGFVAGSDAEPGDIRSDNSTNAVSAGIGLQGGTPRGKLGGFGEIGYLFVHEFRVVNKLTDTNCEITNMWRGPGFFAGGGASVPIGTSWSLTPFASIQWGKFNEHEIKADCGLAESKTDSIPEGQATHGMAFIGIGGEFLFGPDKPVK